MSQSRRAGGTRWPLGLLGSLVLIALIEQGLSRRESIFFTTSWAADWRQAGASANRKVRDCEILCFGDSLNKFGVLPSLLEKKTGLRSYNLALNVGHPASSLFLLRRALESGAKPLAILVDFKSHFLVEKPDTMVRQWPELVRASEWLDLLWETRNPTFATQVLIGSFFTSVRSRFEIRNLVMASLAGDYPDDVYLLPPIKRNWRVNRGAQVIRPSDDDAAKDENGFDLRLFAEDWSCDPIQERYVRRFLHLAVESGAQVFLDIPPPRPDVQKRREALGIEQAYEAFMRQILHDFPGVQVVDGRHADYGRDVHCDSVHLDRNGAIAFSEALGTIIDRSLREPHRQEQWVALPPYEPGGNGVGLEDLVESRLAISGAKGIIR